MNLNLIDFDPVIYKLLNPDLKFLSISELIDHYYNIGINENRIYKFNMPKKFNYIEYKKLNKDLENYNEFECFKHYTLFGFKEKREIFDYNNINIFNYKIYRELNNDLIHFDETKILNHFNNFGKSENRPMIKYHIKKIYYICNILGGGTAKYINDLKYLFNNIIFIKILDKNELYNINFNENDMLIIIHLINNDIIINDIINIYNKFNLNIIITIHDCFWINYKTNYIELTEEDIHGSYLYKNKNINKSVIKLFEIAKISIFPSIFIKEAYEEFYKIKNKIIISHNDTQCKIGKLNIKIVDNIIKIGICHGYSIYKGKELYDILINKYYNKTYKDYTIKFVIVGLTCDNYTENNFIEFLNKNNINGLTLLNKWGESYCYTLTKFLNSGLPILYNNIGAFKERIPKNDKYIDVFGYEEHFVEAINNNNQYLDYFFEKFEKYIDFIIENNNSRLININNNLNIIKSNDFYKDLFFHNIINKNIIIITSKIIVSDLKFSYCDKRSIYSTEERYDQTLETIFSIKKYIPDYYIILFDNSNFYNFDNKKIEYLKSNVDLFLNIYDDSNLNQYTNFYEYKSFGELSQIMKIYDEFLKYINYDSIKSLYKISGRYTLNEHFDYNNFNNKNNILKKNNDLKDIDYYYTCFYKIDNNNIKLFFNNINNVFLNKKKYYKLNLEEIIPELLNYKFELINELGVNQRIAVWNKNIEYI